MTKKTWMFVEWYSFKMKPSPSWFMSPFFLQCDTFVLLFTLKWIGNFLKQLSVVFQYGNGGFRIFSFVLFACNRERAAPPLAWHRTVALLACPATRLTLNTAASTLAWLTGSLACLHMFAVAEMPKKLKTSVVQGCNEKNCHDRLAHQSVVQILFWYWAHNSYSPTPTVLPVASLKKNIHSVGIDDTESGDLTNVFFCRESHRDEGGKDRPHRSAPPPAGHEDRPGPLRTRLLPSAAVWRSVHRAHQQQVSASHHKPLRLFSFWALFFSSHFLS